MRLIFQGISCKDSLELAVVVMNRKEDLSVPVLHATTAPSGALETQMSLKHLTDHHKSQLCGVLAQYPQLFSGDKFVIGEV